MRISSLYNFHIAQCKSPGLQQRSDLNMTARFALYSCTQSRSVVTPVYSVRCPWLLKTKGTWTKYSCVLLSLLSSEHNRQKPLLHTATVFINNLRLRFRPRKRKIQKQSAEIQKPKSFQYYKINCTADTCEELPLEIDILLLTCKAVIMGRKEYFRIFNTIKD